MASQHSVTLYALSTCIHCKHTREFLEENHVAFDCIYVDKLEGDERSTIIDIVRRYNPRISFPTLVVDNGAKVVVGFQPESIREALEI